MNKITRLGVAALLSMASLSAFAEGGGRVLYVEGDAYAVRGRDHIRLEKDSSIFIGDSLVTGERSKLQWAMDDNSLYAMSSNSTLNVDAFSLAPSKATRAGGGSMVMSVLKGAFRSVSGFVGKRRNDDYRINTPVATMGIRGTEYYAVYCNDDCQARVNKDGRVSLIKGQFVKVAGAAQVPNGLYIGVDRGIVTASNDGGSYEFRAGQYGYIASRSKAPVLLEKRPSIFDAIADSLRFNFDPSAVDRARGSSGDSGTGVTGSVNLPGLPGVTVTVPPPPRVEPPPDDGGPNPPPPPPPPPPPVSPS